MTYLPPVETTELITKTEFRAEISRLDDRFDRLEDRVDELSRKIDRVLLAVVGGMFVVLAAIIGTS